MVAQRIGSGGLTYTVDGDATALRAKLSDAAQWAKSVKIKPDIDFEQTTIVRGVEKIRRAIQREVFKAQISVEIDKLGLGQAARAIGAIKGQVSNAAPTALSGMFSTANAIRLAATGYAATLGAQAVAGVGAMGRGFALANSSDAVTSAEGKLGALRAAESIPGIGHFVRAVDEAAGATVKLEAAIKTRLQIEERAVKFAQLSGDPVAVASASGTAAIRQIGRDFSKRVFPGWHPATWGDPTFTGDEIQNIIGQVQENRLNMDIAQRARTATTRGLTTTGNVASLLGAHRPQAADLANLGAQLQTADETAPPFIRDALLPARNAMGGLATWLPLPKFNLQAIANDRVWEGHIASLRREGGLAHFSALTPIGTGELTTQFRGDTTPGAVFAQLRDLQAGIQATPDEDIFSSSGKVNMRSLKRLSALSTARGLGAEFDIQSGGRATRINAGLGQAPDQLIRPPAFEARLEARRMIREFVGNNGGIAGQEFSPLGNLKETNDLIRQLIARVGQLKDNGQGATPLIQTPPRGGARMGVETQ